MLPVTIRTFKLFLLLLTLSTCRTQQESFVGTYIGAWAESFWMIKLRNDSTFNYHVEGHIGNIDLEGNILFRGDTILLNPTSDQQQTESIDFILYQDSCLIELNHFKENNTKISRDYCKGRTDNWSSGDWNIETLTPIIEE